MAERRLRRLRGIRMRQVLEQIDATELLKNAFLSQTSQGTPGSGVSTTNDGDDKTADNDASSTQEKESGVLQYPEQASMKGRELQASIRQRSHGKASEASKTKTPASGIKGPEREDSTEEPENKNVCGEAERGEPCKIKQEDSAEEAEDHTVDGHASSDKPCDTKQENSAGEPEIRPVAEDSKIQRADNNKPDGDKIATQLPPSPPSYFKPLLEVSQFTIHDVTTFGRGQPILSTIWSYPSPLHMSHNTRRGDIIHIKEQPSDR